MKSSYFLFLCCLLALRAPAQTIYVRSSAAGANNGSSWANAFTTLDAALNAAQPGQQIWVAAGTYLPNDDVPNNSFYLQSGVELYGGFSGTETALSQRNYTANATVLSGDLAGDDVVGNFTQHRADNSRHVLQVLDGDPDDRAIVDGFTIRSGQTLTVDSLPNNELQGGGIYALATLTVRNSRFTDNFGYGSASIAVVGDVASGFVADNCVFEQNTATAQAAGIVLFGVFGADVNNCVFRNNTTNRGCLYPLESLFVTIDSCLFEDNVAGADQYCAALFGWQSDFTVSQSTFRGNQAGNAGAIYADGRNGGNFFTLENCVFENNSAGGFGGALFTWQAEFLVNHCTFRENQAPNAAAMYNDGRDGISAFEVRNSWFEANMTSDYGGSALYNWYGDYLLDSTTFLNNQSSYTAGAIYNANTNAQISHCRFEGNRATFGGAVANFNAETNVTLDSCEFFNNEAVTSGGAVINGFQSTTALQHCLFQVNAASFGGAVYSQSDSTRLTVQDCSFKSNSAGNFGGAVQSSGGIATTVHDSYFEANTAAFGGALAISEDSLDLAQLNVENSIFVVNFALTQAGALNLSNTDVALKNCLFANNTNLGTGAGGAISNNASDDKSSNLTAINCTFANNEAVLGAGIAQWENALLPGSNATLTLQNCILQNPGGANYEVEAGVPEVISLGGNLSSDASLAGALTQTKDVQNESTTFVDPFNFNYHLLNGDANTLDGGIAAGAPAYDLDGNPRLGDPDKGAYEFSASGTSAPLALPLVLAPNPAGEYVLLQWDASGPAIIVVQDAQGRVIRQFRRDKSDAPLRLEVGDLPTGFYPVSVRLGDRLWTGELVKK